MSDSSTNYPDHHPQHSIDWPVTGEAALQYETVRHSHRTKPLKVIYNGQYIAPEDVENTICNAIVEITFTMKHQHFYTQNCDHSRVTADIQQIIVIGPAS
jgi:hypothetical protein